MFHSGAPEAEDVAGCLAATWELQPAMGLIGAVTGSHLGPRALGVALLVRR